MNNSSASAFKTIVNDWGVWQSTPDCFQIHLPELEKGSILIMDNASFHKSSILTEIIEQHDCYLLFLPSYSPDLNPIEQAWATLKQKIKKARRGINDIFKAISFAFNDVLT
jgi:transposase